MRPTTTASWVLGTLIAFGIGSALGAASARADALLDEMVEFTGQIFFIDAKVPAVVIGAVRDGEMSVRAARATRPALISALAL